jgi:hypothetical protein
MSSESIAKKRLSFSLSPIDELIWEKKVARCNFFLHASNGRDAQTAGDPKLFEGKDIRTIIQFMRQEFVVFPVTRKKKDRHAVVFELYNGCRWLAERSLDLVNCFSFKAREGV